MDLDPRVIYDPNRGLDYKTELLHRHGHQRPMCTLLSQADTFETNSQP